MVKGTTRAPPVDETSCLIHWLIKSGSPHAARTSVKPNQVDVQRQGRAAHTVISMARSGTARNTQQGRFSGKWWPAGKKQRRGKMLLAKNPPRVCKPQGCSLSAVSESRMAFNEQGKEKMLLFSKSTCCHTLNDNLLFTMGRNCITCSINTRKFNLPYR